MEEEEESSDFSFLLVKNSQGFQEISSQSGNSSSMSLEYLIKSRD